MPLRVEDIRAMELQVGDLRKMIAGVPDDFGVRILVPCRVVKEFAEVEKPLANGKAIQGRKLLILETQILELGPR